MEVIGRYEVVRELGHGAMGRVYLARDPALERLVALKLLHDHASQEDARARFRDEAKALAALNHPGIVAIYEIGTHDNDDFIAMEYLAGRSLREVLQGADCTARRDELVAICARVAVAVAAAHHAGILHRDIKPENVVVGDAGDIKVVDFGIARRLNDAPEPRRPIRRMATPIEQVEDVIDAFMATVPVTRTDRDTLATAAQQLLTAGNHTVFGTPGYMAPEVLTGRDSNEASDVYSLGVMLYECLAGRRPYDAPALAAVMAMVVDDTVQPEPLDDPRWELVARMLARDPMLRPSLDEVAAALAPVKASPRQRRWPVAAAAGAALVLGAVGAWRVSRDHATPAARDSADLAHVTIVVEPISAVIPSYGAQAPTGLALSDVMSTLLGKTHGLKVTSYGAGDLMHALGMPAPTFAWHPDLTLAERQSAERKLAAEYIVRGSIAERDGTLRAHVTLSWPLGGVTLVDRERPSAELAKLIDELADGVAKAIDPEAALGHTPDRDLAMAFTEAGAARLADNRFYDARPFLEQAVDADEGSFEAWYALASTRSWMMAPEQDVAVAIDKALALAPAGVQKELLKGVSLCLHDAYGAAIPQLQPLEAAQGLTNTELRDLYYYLGEAHYHFGHQAVGIAYFRRALQRDPKFKPATIHPLYYAFGRRDVAAGREMVALAGTLDFTGVEFSEGHYADVAGRPGDYQLFAQLVLGRPPAPDLLAKQGPLDHANLQIAMALEAGDETAFARELDALWTRVRADRGKVGENSYYQLVQLGDVLLCGERPAELRELLTFLADDARTKPGTGYRRLAMFAKRLVDDRTAIDRTDLTDRERQVADAVEADLAGQHARAALLFKQLVDDPTPSWNFPERLALLRNLRALHRTKEADAVCAELRHPALFHFALLPARRHCPR